MNTDAQNDDHRYTLVVSPSKSYIRLRAKQFVKLDANEVRDLIAWLQEWLTNAEKGAPAP